MSSPVSARARSRNCGALAASRQASVAIRPERATRCRRILAAHTCSASMRALDGGLRQPAAGEHALAQADDAREGVDDLEAAPRRAAPPAGGSCWCRDRARRRRACGRLARRRLGRCQSPVGRRPRAATQAAHGSAHASGAATASPSPHSTGGAQLGCAVLRPCGPPPACLPRPVTAR